MRYKTESLVSGSLIGRCFIVTVVRFGGCGVSVERIFNNYVTKVYPFVV